MANKDTISFEQWFFLSLYTMPWHCLSIQGFLLIVNIRVQKTQINSYIATFYDVMNGAKKFTGGPNFTQSKW